MADSFQRPTLAELVTRISNDLKSYTGQDSFVRRSMTWILARILAGAVHLLYGFASWIARQILPDTASDALLLRHASLYGLTPIPATFAAGDVEFPGTNGTEIEAGTILQREDGAEFTVTTGGTVSGGVVTVTATAVVAGLAGNCAAGTTLALASPIAGITGDGTVADAPDDIAGGRDEETVEELRTRFLARKAQQPQGGALADYDQWTRAAVADVSGVFVVPGEFGAGTVGVRFTVQGTGAGIIPDAGQVSDVQGYIDVKKPVTADVTVLAPDGLAVTLTIAVVPNTTAVKAAVAAELDALFVREAKPGGTIPNSRIREAISRAAGETSHTLSAVGGGAGTADVVQDSSEVAYLGTITWA